jgi:hypothetical protein
MHPYVALLRGANVGCANRVPMAAPRTLLTEEGVRDVQTVLDSGNVVIAATGAGTAPRAFGRRFPALSTSTCRSSSGPRRTFARSFATSRRRELPSVPVVRSWPSCRTPDASIASRRSARSSLRPSGSRSAGTRPASGSPGFPSGSCRRCATRPSRPPGHQPEPVHGPQDRGASPSRCGLTPPSGEAVP